MSASAERDSSTAINLSKVAQQLLERSSTLEWMLPNSASLVALAREPVSSLWESLRKDPNALLLLLRSRHTQDSPSPNLPSTLRNGTVLQQALASLDDRSGVFVDWATPTCRHLLETGLHIANYAEALAIRTQQVEPETAWMTGLLAPLGWYAVAALAPEHLDRLIEWEGSSDPAESLAHDLTRRLVRAWQLPEWIALVLTHYPLSSQIALQVGADVDLIHHVQVAVDLAREDGCSLHLVGTEWAKEGMRSMGLSRTVLQTVRSECQMRLPPKMTWEDPRETPLLRDLLGLAIENCSLREGKGQQRLEAENDRLHRTLANLVRTESQRLRDDRLSGLAELAAGAGHEINNPLAVISGQAQYLLGHAGEWFTEEAGDKTKSSLQAIIAQTRRIHTLLRDLIQFARPTTPKFQWADLPTLLGEVTSSCMEFAAQQQVRLELVCVPERLNVSMDPEQIRKALDCLVRNGIEATPKEGWVRLYLAQPESDAADIDILVEDSGPGPNEEQEAHLFDPFYSGRQAGRGKGMGLPIAWRLTRIHGGDVRLDPVLTQGPTRFIVSLPRSQTMPQPSDNGAGSRITAPPVLRMTSEQSSPSS